MVNIETNKKIIQGSFEQKIGKKRKFLFLNMEQSEQLKKSFTCASSFYICTQFLDVHPVFCPACSFDIIKCIQSKIAFPWVRWGEMRIT